MKRKNTRLIALNRCLHKKFPRSYKDFFTSRWWSKWYNFQMNEVCNWHFTVHNSLFTKNQPIMHPFLWVRVILAKRDASKKQPFKSIVQYRYQLQGNHFLFGPGLNQHFTIHTILSRAHTALHAMNKVFAEIPRRREAEAFSNQELFRLQAIETSWSE